MYLAYTAKVRIYQPYEQKLNSRIQLKVFRFYCPTKMDRAKFMEDAYTSSVIQNSCSIIFLNSIWSIQQTSLGVICPDAKTTRKQSIRHEEQEEKGIL